MDGWIDFHDAYLTEISHEDGDLILHIESATIGSSDNVAEWKNQDGALHLVGIREIRIDGTPAPEVMLLSPDNTIHSLSFANGRAQAFIRWFLPSVPYGELCHEYEVICTDVKWRPATASS